MTKILLKKGLKSFNTFFKLHCSKAFKWFAQTLWFYGNCSMPDKTALLKSLDSQTFLYLY